MLGLRITINQESAVVVAAADATQILVMLTATGVLGPDTAPKWPGENYTCWLSVRLRQRRAGEDRRARVLHRALGSGDRLTVEIVEADSATIPLSEVEADEARADAPVTMLGFAVGVNEDAVVTGAGDDLYVLTAILGASGDLGNKAAAEVIAQASVFRLSLGGLTRRDDDRGEHLDWIQRDDLQVGDRVTIHILDTTHASVPKERSPA